VSGCFALGGCSSKLVVRSEPPEATLSYVVPDTKERKPLGATPYSINSQQLNEITRFSPTSGDMLEFVVEKEGFAPRSMLVPYNRMLSMSADVFVKLDEQKKDQSVYRQLVQHLVNAQDFLNRNELDRADFEIQRALKLDADFPWSHLLRGHILFLKREYSQSLRSYERVVELDPVNQEARRMISKARKSLKIDVESGREPAQLPGGSESAP
jgi:tetratricopeptide (TPR) repeat protein